MFARSALIRAVAAGSVARPRAATVAALGRRHNQQATADSGKYDDLDVTRRRLIYRSKQRGWCGHASGPAREAAAQCRKLQNCTYDRASLNPECCCLPRSG